MRSEADNPDGYLFQYEEDYNQALPEFDSKKLFALLKTDEALWDANLAKVKKRQKAGAGQL